MNIALQALLGPAGEAAAEVVTKAVAKAVESPEVPQRQRASDVFGKIEAAAEVLKLIEEYRRQQLEARFRMYELMQRAGHGATGGAGG